MIASLNICAAVHGTVDDNVAIHVAGDGNQGGERGRIYVVYIPSKVFFYVRPG